MSNQKQKDVIDLVEETKNNPNNELSFAEQIAQALMIAQQTNNAQQAEQQRLKDIEFKMRSADVGGKASLAFREKMQKEIADGNYTPIRYYPAMAKKFGSDTDVTISGYSVEFHINQTTLVPNSLLYAVEKKFGDLKGYSTDSIPNFVVSDRNTGRVDVLASQQVAQGVTSMLEADGIRFR